MNLLPDFLRKRNKTEIEAVYNSDLEELLQSLGILEEVNRGEVECEFCETTITFDNIGKIYGEENQVKIICDDIKCIES